MTSGSRRGSPPVLPSSGRTIRCGRRTRSWRPTAWRRGSAVYGHAGPAGPKAAEVLSKYIIVDMYAKAVQGMSAEDAVKWADGEVRKVYN